MNISLKKRASRSEPDLTVVDVQKLRSVHLTKRMLLGITNDFPDFLDIANPHTIKFKVLMRAPFLLEEPLSWDDCVPENI